MGVGAVLEQEDPVLAAQPGDLLALEREMAADVDQEAGARAVLLDLRRDVLGRRAQVLAIAVDEDGPAPGGDDGQRRRHERVRRAQDGLALHPGVAQRGECAAAPGAGG